jgi:hypothetical protein
MLDEFSPNQVVGFATEYSSFKSNLYQNVNLLKDLFTSLWLVLLFILFDISLFADAESENAFLH